MKKFVIVTLLGLVLLPTLAHGQATTFSIESVSVGLGSADLKTTTLNIIQWVLGFLALAAVVMIIFSGFIAATAQESERAEAARKTIVAAVIGLIIVLLAWAIVIFVARTTANVTQN